METTIFTYSHSMAEKSREMHSPMAFRKSHMKCWDMMTPIVGIILDDAQIEPGGRSGKLLNSS